MTETPELTDEQREELAAVLATHEPHDSRVFYGSGVRLVDALSTVVARMVADAEQRGRDEVSAAVEAALQGATSDDLGGVAAELVYDLRAILTDPAAAVARIKAETEQRTVLRPRVAGVGGAPGRGVG